MFKWDLRAETGFIKFECASKFCVGVRIAVRVSLLVGVRLKPCASQQRKTN